MILVCDTYHPYDPTAIERFIDSDEPRKLEPLANGFLDLCHALWAELHCRESPTQKWFDDWMFRIPRFGCDCQSDFRKYVANNPPDFGEGWYRWTVAAHNFVNAKLQKPIWAIDSQSSVG